MAFNFNWSPLTADADFYRRARDLLTKALNKSPKPPIIVDDILVSEFNLGTVPPDLEILEIGDLAEDRFRGIFKMTYSGDAFLTLKTRVQVRLFGFLYLPFLFEASIWYHISYFFPSISFEASDSIANAPSCLIHLGNVLSGEVVTRIAIHQPSNFSSHQQHLPFPPNFYSHIVSFHCIDVTLFDCDNAHQTPPAPCQSTCFSALTYDFIHAMLLAQPLTAHNYRPIP
jgi:hypothetical protein